MAIPIRQPQHGDDFPALLKAITDSTQARTLLELEQTLQLERALRRRQTNSAPLPGAQRPAAMQATISQPHHGGAAQPVEPERAAELIGDPYERCELPAEAPMRDPYPLRFGVTSLLQGCAATAAGAALFLTISAWLHWLRPEAPYVARVSPPQTLAENVPTREVQTAEPAPVLAETVGSAQYRRAGTGQAPQSGLPFPLPGRYGVYAGSNRGLTELEPLPVEVPPPRARLSAEITKPGGAMLFGDRPTFVAFKPNLANGGATVSARVVARVSRAVSFVNLRARVTPLQSSWRIRDTSFEFKATPLEGYRDMIVLQPEAALPAGRYALVLDGRGYDFTIAGPITAPEQCLEQTQVVNGVVIAQCPES